MNEVMQKLWDHPVKSLVVAFVAVCIVALVYNLLRSILTGKSCVNPVKEVADQLEKDVEAVEKHL